MGDNEASEPFLDNDRAQLLPQTLVALVEFHHSIERVRVPAKKGDLERILRTIRKALQDLKLPFSMANVNIVKGKLIFALVHRHVEAEIREEIKAAFAADTEHIK